MRVLLVHDDSTMSSILAAELGSKQLFPESLDLTSVTDAVLRAGCHDNDAVIYVSTGWDDSAALREASQVETVISALGGSGKRLVYVCEATVIGDTGDGFGNEDSPPSAKAPHSWRVQAERRVERAISTGVRSVVVRPALVHGRGAGAVISSLTAHARATGHAVYVGDGSARVSTVHVDDVVSLIRLATLRAPEGFVCSAASPEVLTWRQVADAVARVTGPQCDVVSVTAEEAQRAGLDVGTMTISNVMHDGSAHRRLGWTPSGVRLADEVHALAR